MQEMWVLTVKTSLPNTGYNSGDWTTTCKVCNCFEKGREALREAVKKLAFSENSMFDGQGNIRYYRDYAENGYDDGDEEEDVTDFLNKKRLVMVADALQAAFSGKEVRLPPVEHWDDDMLAVEAANDAIHIFGYGDGPCNGYVPDIHTNIFSMQEEKQYFLYINDMFGQSENSSELYIDLMKAEVE